LAFAGFALGSLPTKEESQELRNHLGKLSQVELGEMLSEAKYQNCLENT
jgi:hypothetical protein